MPDYDPTAEALVAALREVLAPPGRNASRTYIDDLRAVQVALVELLAQETPEAPDPETDALMRQALGRVDPKNEDQYLGYGEVLRRLVNSLSGPRAWCSRSGRAGTTRCRSMTNPR